MGYIPRSTIKIIAKEFEEELNGYTVKKYCSGDFITVYVIDDSLVLLAQIVGYKCSLCINAEEMYGGYRKNPYLEFPVNGREYYLFRIEELTPNTIEFKYNNKKFASRITKVTGIGFAHLSISYSKYTSNRGNFWQYSAPQFGTDTNGRISKLFPELRLEERCNQWEGEKYSYIVLEFEDVNGQIHRTVAYTTSRPSDYVNQLCAGLIKSGKLFGNGIMGSGLIEREINTAFDSWKGIKRQKRLEEHFKYFIVEKYFSDKSEAASFSRDVLNRAYRGDYETIERSTYLRPVNKWISEELVYKHAKKIYGKRYAVIYQHRPFFLISHKGGQMSYDVYISELDIAIEYQGRQHFEPVDFFGGQNAYDELVIRDKEKANLSKKNGVKLVYINYWEEITPSLIIERVGIEPP